MHNLAYTVLHIESGSEVSSSRDKNVLSIKEKLKNKISYLYTQTHKISNINELNYYKDNYNKLNISGKLRYGDIGCMVSHYDSWTKLLNSEYDLLIVIEDDANLSDDFLENVYKYILDLPYDFDIATLYVHPKRNEYYDALLHDVGLSYMCLGFQDRSTLSYVISRDGAKKYKNFVDTIYNMPIDLFLFDKEKNTKFYSISPSAKPLFYCETLDQNGEVLHGLTNIHNTEWVDL